MDLHAPLGREPRPRKRRILPILGASIFAVGAAGLGTYFFRADPNGGQPYAIALIPSQPSPKAVPTTSSDPTPTGSISSPKMTSGERSYVENGVKVVSPPPEGERSQARGNGPLVIDVSKALDSDARKYASTDRSKTQGTSSNVVSAPIKAVVGSKRPRVAIFVGGLGLSQGATRTATEIMPAAVTLAFVPYGDSLPTDVASAKAKGHEILLQLPMQNAQGALLGPHTLTTSETAAQAISDLDWLMGRFDGYVGVTNLLGAPVTSNSTVMTTILKGVHKRGVFYVDDGTSKRSLAPSLAPSAGLEPIQADVVLDATGDAVVVRANLERLTAIAQKKGSAIGVASGLSDHLATVARFAADLDSRGFSLVPLSTLAQDSASVATAR